MNPSTTSLDRRSFIKVSALAGGGMLIGIHRLTAQSAKEDASLATPLNAFIQIAPDGTITIASPNPEIGQGVKTAMPMIVAEELDADWSTVVVQQAPLDTAHFSRQVAGGSGSIKAAWTGLREAGATARALLVLAAAQRWNVEPVSCTTHKSRVLHPASNRSLSYGELAAEAASLTPPKDVPLKSLKDFQLIGTRVANVDNAAITTGKKLFGSDLKREGMAIAVVARPPAFGYKLESVDDTQARTMPGVQQVIRFGDKVAVLANTTWEAKKGRDALVLKWTSASPAENTDTHYAQLRELLEKPGNTARRKDGNTQPAFEQAAKVIEATYECPFLPHNPMEPLNFFADVRPDQVLLIGPTQTPERARNDVANLLKIDPSLVQVEMTRQGGGFGRRLSADYAVEAAEISSLAKKPVKVIWMREDDMGGGIYRPSCAYTYRAALDAQGHISGFHVRGAGINVGNPTRENNFPAGALSNYLAEGHNLESNVTTGPWRAPVHNFLAFAEQCFLDEVAIASGKDPVQLRLELLDQAAKSPTGKVEYDVARFKGVIQLAAEKSNWGRPQPGIYQGFSAYYSFSSYVAQVVEIRLENNTPRIHRIVCAVDCGVLINRSGAENQVVGGIIDGLSHAMFGQVTIKDGVPQQTNFDTYRLMRIGEAPNAEVHFVESQEAPTGLGEPALPPFAAAYGNALFRATGQRLRIQPFIQSSQPGLPG